MMKADEIADLLNQDADGIANTTWRLLEDTTSEERAALLACYFAGLLYAAEKGPHGALGEVVDCGEYCESRGWLPLDWGIPKATQFVPRRWLRHPKRIRGIRR